MNDDLDLEAEYVTDSSCDHSEACSEASLDQFENRQRDMAALQENASQQRRFVVFRRLQNKEVDWEGKDVKDGGLSQGPHSLVIVEQPSPKRGVSGKTKVQISTDDDSRVVVCTSHEPRQPTLTGQSSARWGQLAEVSHVVEGSLARKRSPSNKQPVKVFAGKDLGVYPEESDSVNRPALGKPGKFSFPKLTIDVDEANKQLLSSKQPPRLSRIVDCEARVTSAAEPKSDNKNTVEFVRTFYQEHIDKLASRNEELLRENERLRIELAKSAEISAEAEVLRQQVVELQKIAGLSRQVSGDSPVPAGFGELRSNLRSRGAAGGQHLNIRTSELMGNCSEATFKDSMPGSVKPTSQSKRAYNRDAGAHLGSLSGNRKIERTPAGNSFEEKSLSYSRTSQDLKEHQNSRKITDCMEEYQYDMRRVTSQNASFDTHEVHERDPNYLKDFISKLKQASEGITKNLKLGNSHKKTASLVSAQGKRRDLTGYYVTQKKVKEGDPSRKSRGTASRLDSLISDKADSKLTMTLSRSHATNLVKKIEKSYKHHSQMYGVAKEPSEGTSDANESRKETYLPSGMKKSNKPKGTKIVLQGLLKQGVSHFDSRFGSHGFSKQTESRDAAKPLHKG
jgi:hypothetical protein